MNVSISFTGVREIDQILANLPKELNHKILGAAHAAAAKPLVEREKLLAPEGPTGHLVDSIGLIKSSFKRADSLGEVIVGPRRRRGGQHAHLVEFGTRRRTNKRGANRGIMPKHPFVQPAFNQEKGTVERGIALEVGKSVVRTMRRYAR